MGGVPQLDPTIEMAMCASSATTMPTLATWTREVLTYIGKHADYISLRGYAPHLIEQVCNLEDASVLAQFLNSFIRHVDVVKIANLARW